MKSFPTRAAIPFLFLAILALLAALLHAVCIGFVISMIFGHAPIIFPGVLGVPINFQPAFSVQVVLLHASLVSITSICMLSAYGAVC